MESGFFARLFRGKFLKIFNRGGAEDTGCFLLPDAEIAEDNVEEVFDIDAAGDATERADGKAHVFSDHFRQRGGEGTVQAVAAFSQRGAVTLAGQGRGIAVAADQLFDLCD